MNYWFRSRSVLDAASELLSAKEPDEAAAAALDQLLRTHADALNDFTHHKGKSSSERSLVESAASGGTQVSFVDASGRSRGSVSVDSRQSKETLLLADVFGLNELLALELLLAGDAESGSLGFGRGLAAVLAFHNSARCAADAIRLLFESRSGRLWAPVGQDSELTAVVHRATANFWAQGLLATYLRILETASPDKEIERLADPSVKGIGGAKHAALLRDILGGTYEAMANTVLLYAAQEGLSLADIQALIAYFKKREVDTPKDGSRGGVPWRASVDGTLLVALLYGLDASLLEEVETEEELGLVSLGSDPGLVGGVCRELGVAGGWRDGGLLALLQVAWATALRQLSQHHLASQVVESVEVDEEDLWESAVDAGAWLTLRKALTSNQGTRPFYQRQELWLRRLHSLVTGTIVCFPLKLKELRAAADEELREAQESRLPAPLQLHFHHFLLLMRDVYESDGLGLHLSEDFLCAGGEADGSSVHGSLFHHARAALSPNQAALHKFVETAGELLPAQLYVAYLGLLRSLAASPPAARAVFHLLKSNAMTGSHSLSGVSWTRLWEALGSYVSLLRGPPKAERGAVWGPQPTEPPPASVHFQPDELEGLVAWLRLTARVAEQDPEARLHLAEYPEWRVVSRLIDLASCSVPLRLKGAVWEVLGALAGGASGPGIWTQLGLSGAFGPQAAFDAFGDGKAPPGVLRELEDVEVRLEEYPATLGFLRLLLALTSHAQAACPDPAGFAKFTEAYVVKAVLGKFLHRPYKDPKQMWEVGDLCFRVLHQLLEGWTESLELGTAKLEGRGDAGLGALKSLTSDGPAFRVLLSYLVKSEALLALHLPDLDCRVEMEAGSLSGLRLLSSVLSREELLGAAESSGLVPTSARQLLLSLNPATMSPDYLAKLCGFLAFAATLPTHCRLVLDCLRRLAAHPAYQLTGTLERLGGPSLSGNFAALLDPSADLRAPLFEEDDEGEGDGDIRGSLGVSVLELLLESLQGGQGSLALFLLGFHAQDPANSQIEEPGVGGSLRSCLHTATDIVQRGLERGLAGLPFRGLVEPAGRLLATLCADSVLGPPTLRYLRSSHDLFAGAVASLHRIPPKDSGPSWMAFLGHVLRLVSEELGHLIATGQSSQIRRLAGPLLAQAHRDAHGGTESVDWSSSGLLSMTATTLNASVAAGVGGSASLLLSVLSSLDLDSESIDGPALAFFDSRKLAQVISVCSRLELSGAVECSVGRLHGLLERELGALSGTPGAAQHASIQNEVESVLRHVVAYNGLQRRTAARLGAWEAWRLLTEALVSGSVAPLLAQSSVFASAEAQSAAYAGLLTAVLNKANEGDFLREAQGSLGSLCLALTSAIRRVFNAAMPSDDDTTMGDSRLCGGDMSYLTVLDGTRVGAGRSGGAARALAPLLHPLRLLCQFLVKPGAKDAATKAFSTGALLNFLYLLKPNKNAAGSGDMGGEGWSLRERMSLEQWRVLASFGPQLAPVLARDAAEGPAALKSLALCALSLILSEDGARGGSLIQLISQQGDLSALVGSVRGESGEMLDCLSSLSAPLTPLFLYRTKMMFLSRLAGTEGGVGRLLSEGLVEVLREAGLFSCAPPPAFAAASQGARDQVETSLLARYYLMVESTLELLLALCTGQSGDGDPAACAKVLGFLCGEGEAVMGLFGGGGGEAALLRGPVAAHPPTLALLTALISKAASRPVDWASVGVSAVEVETGRDSFLRALLGLLRIGADYPRFLCDEEKGHEPSDTLRFRGGAGSSGASAGGRDSLGLAWRQSHVVNHVVSSLAHSLHCFCALTAEAMDKSGGRLESVVFSEPSFDDQGSRSSRSLWSLSRCLRTGLSESAVVGERLSAVQGALTDLPDLEIRELEKLETSLDVGNSEVGGRGPRSSRVRSRLLELRGRLKDQRRLLRELLSSSLWLIWAHLDFYLRQCAPRAELESLGPSVYSLLTHRPLKEAGHSEQSRLSRSEHATLLREAASLFHHTFVDKLTQLYQTESTTVMDFGEQPGRFEMQNLQKILRLVRT